MECFKKSRMKFLFLIMFIFPLAVSARSFGETRNLSLLSEGISEMDIDCGAGFLKLRGVESLDEIKVKAEITAGNKKGEKLKEFIDENVDLSLEKQGSRAVLISRFDHSIFRVSGDYQIDLTVEIPMVLNITIKDGSGNLEVKNINGDLKITDGSGSIEIANVNGRVKINDGSGDLEAKKISGNTEIRDGSGNIEIEDLTGNLVVTDGSGYTKLDKIRGDLDIRDGSGSLTTTDIDGNVKIHDGSGSINIDGVSKDVDIPEAGSGGVHLKNIKGKVNGDF